MSLRRGTGNRTVCAGGVLGDEDEGQSGEEMVGSAERFLGGANSDQRAFVNIADEAEAGTSLYESTLAGLYEGRGCNENFTRHRSIIVAKEGCVN